MKGRKLWGGKGKIFALNVDMKQGSGWGDALAVGHGTPFCEAPVSNKGVKKAAGRSSVEKAAPLAECDDSSPEERFPSCSQEFDRVLGGGIVPGSVTLWVVLRNWKIHTASTVGCLCS